MNKNTLLISIVSILAVAVIGVFVYFFIDGKRQEAQTALIQKQQEEQRIKDEAERAKRAKEEKEKEDIKNGLDKSIGGRIESINQSEKSFVLDLDPLGNHQRYTIRTSDQTEFKMTYVDVTVIDRNKSADEGGEKMEEKVMDADFGSLKEGADAQVEFDKRIDIDNEKNLQAAKVNLIYYKTFE